MGNKHQEIMDIAVEIEDEYFVGEFGVNSEWAKFFKDTEYEDLFLDMVVHMRETVGLIIDLSMAMKKNNV